MSAEADQALITRLRADSFDVEDAGVFQPSIICSCDFHKFGKVKLGAKLKDGTNAHTEAFPIEDAYRSLVAMLRSAKT